MEHPELNQPARAQEACSSRGRDSSLAFVGAPSGVRELTSGVDALYVSGRAALPSSLVGVLEDCRSAAAETRQLVPLRLGDVDFGVDGRGLGKYRFCLHHRYGVVGVTPSETLPALRIQPRTEFLHAVGPIEAVEWFAQAFGEAIGPLRLSVSRIDLHCDVQGWHLDGEDRHRFLCRADSRVLYETNEEFTGFAFGNRKTNTITARVYDKTRQLGDDLKFWPDQWGDRYDPSDKVLRVEFEVGRTALREFRLDGPRDVLASVGGLWASLTTWLSFRNETSDGTRSRWPVADEWKAITHARVGADALGLDRAYGNGTPDLERLCLQLSGYLSSVGALVDTEGIDDTCARLPALLRDVELRTGKSFSKRITDKRRARAFQ